MLKDLGIPTPEFADVLSQDDLDVAVARIGLPAVLKTRTLGYDGKGQKVLRKLGDVVDAFAELGSVPCILEGFVPFTGEVSLIAVRGRDGQTCFYPLVHNTHEAGILRLSVASSNHPLQALAEDYAGRVLQHLDYVGVLAFEFFEIDGGLKANEIAGDYRPAAGLDRQAGRKRHAQLHRRSAASGEGHRHRGLPPASLRQGVQGRAQGRPRHAALPGPRHPGSPDHRRGVADRSGLSADSAANCAARLGSEYRYREPSFGPEE